VRGARRAITDILARGRPPIVEGGTMLYVEAVTEGLTLAGVAPNKTLRDSLEKLNVDALSKRLLALDPDPGVDVRNPVRMIRAIEVLEAVGPPLSRLRTRETPPWSFIRLG